MNTQQQTAQPARVNHHPDLVQYYANDLDDSDAQLICYFDEGTTNLWHVYVEGKEIFNLLSDTVIEALEREFAKHQRNEIKQHNLDLAIDRYEGSLQ